MVMNNHSYEDQTRRLLTEAQSELNTLDEEIADLQNKRVGVAREVDAYETALQGYLRRIGKQEGAENWKSILAVYDIHRDRIEAIAKHSGGKIRVSQVTDILLSNGFIKAKKRSTAYSMIQGYLADMTYAGVFEKVAPGEYRLVGAQQSLPGVSQT